jgi:two-component system sensor histidine kinase KdpD
VWLLAWLAMVLLDGHVDLANQALILVVAAALGALWLPATASMIVCALAVLSFNFAFVPPRGTFTVDLHQHVLLLITMLAVSWLIALLMARQRKLAVDARIQFERAEQLRDLGEALRDAADPRSCAPALQQALSGLAGAPSSLLLLPASPGDAKKLDACAALGPMTAAEKADLWTALRESRDMVHGIDRAPDRRAWYLPMRGRTASFGAALLPLPAEPVDAGELRSQAQALCDQMGLALERAAAMRAAAEARESAQSQALRNTLLAAISHDHRTPLAAILGAASSLHDQSERLAPEQRRRLAAVIVDEATQLARLTDNTLQLARLDSPGLALHKDWESVEEIVGTVLRRLRQRGEPRRIRTRLEPGLPLVRCDVILLVQLLENLVDNAFKYGGDPDQVELRARRTDDRLVLAICDRGPGVPPEWRSRIFDAFQRIPTPRMASRDAEAKTRRGAGVGLAVCRAIARAHGGDLTCRPRAHGGSCFECSLPLELPPAGESRQASAGSQP